MPLHPQVLAVTERIARRSEATRGAYLRQIAEAARSTPVRNMLACGNQAHAWAAAPREDKLILRELRQPNLGIVSAYNDMLSAHQPYERYPAVIREAARAVGGVAQVAGGVPAMCDGITQGNAGMMAGALLAALADVHAATAAVLMHALPTEPAAVGVERALIAALLVHAVSKSVVAWVSGGSAYALAVAPGVLAHTLAFVGVLVLL